MDSSKLNVSEEKLSLNFTLYLVGKNIILRNLYKTHYDDVIAFIKEPRIQILNGEVSALEKFTGLESKKKKMALLQLISLILTLFELN